MPENHSDFRKLIISNRDGTYTRLIQFPTTAASPNSSSHVLSKDILINPSHQTWLRIYLPRHLLDSPSTTTNNRRRPLTIYFHGGGFVFDTPASTHNHEFCFNMSQNINAVVVCVQYRLAPEHRLPAAYDDAVEALQFIKLREDDWLREFADLSSCFFMGTSAGGNIAYQATLRACKLKLEPLKIKGLILHHPFFGGSERTGSELDRVFDLILPLFLSDFLWELALPTGSDRDHEYCSPRTCFDLNKFGSFLDMGLRVLVLGCYDDPLIDRCVELAKMLEERGVRTVTHLVEGLHGLEVNDPTKAESLFPVLKDFMFSCST